MDRFQYLLLLLACALLTLPLEWLYDARVWRRPVRLARTLALPFAVFWAVDVQAIVRRTWTYNADYTTGWTVPIRLPIEEAVFFVVIPLCAILTFQTATNVYEGKVPPLWRRVRRARSERAGTGNRR